jgi:type II secretory pathway pseudopilin PulG
MVSKFRLNQRGTTLAESLVALGLFGLAAAATGSLLTTQMRMQRGNTYRTNAIALATAQLENLRGMDYDEMPTDSTASSTIQLGGLSYGVSSRVRANSPAQGMKAITVTVAYTAPAGPQSYSLDAIYTSIKR